MKSLNPQSFKYSELQQFFKEKTALHKPLCILFGLFILNKKIVKHLTGVSDINYVNIINNGDGGYHEYIQTAEKPGPEW